MVTINKMDNRTQPVQLIAPHQPVGHGIAPLRVEIIT